MRCMWQNVANWNVLTGVVYETQEIYGNSFTGSTQPVSNFPGLMSTPMIREAPAFLQPMIAASPTAPRPNTAQLEPGSTLAVLIAAPYPVEMPHPSRQTLSSPALLSTWHMTFNIISYDERWWTVDWCTSNRKVHMVLLSAWPLTSKCN